MIAFLQGTVHSLTEQTLVVFVNGLGYAVNVTARAIDSAHVGSDIELHTYQHIREDALDLYGFADQQELQVFRRLLGVSGVGPRMALTILSHLDPAAVSHAVAAGDVAALKAVSGVGKKTAERIVIDLKDSVAEWSVGAVQAADGGAQNVTAVAALESLGFSAIEAAEVLKGVDSMLPIEEQVRAALKSTS